MAAKFYSFIFVTFFTHWIYQSLQYTFRSLLNGMQIWSSGPDRSTLYVGKESLMAAKFFSFIFVTFFIHIEFTNLYNILPGAGKMACEPKTKAPTGSRFMSERSPWWLPNFILIFSFFTHWIYQNLKYSSRCWQNGMQIWSSDPDRSTRCVGKASLRPWEGRSGNYWPDVMIVPRCWKTTGYLLLR